MLNTYLIQVRRLIHDQQVIEFIKDDLVDYINQARVDIALQAKCVRHVPQNIVTVADQEVYPFSGFDVTGFPGVASVFSVGSIAVLFGNWQFVLRRVSFSRYQAWVRVYSTGFQDVPTVWSQVGDGEGAQAYLYPIANQAYPIYPDCYCLPIELHSDADHEAIPSMFQRCVKYYAAYMALASLPAEGPAKLSERMLALYERSIQVGRAASTTSFVSNWYGRR